MISWTVFNQKLMEFAHRKVLLRVGHHWCCFTQCSIQVQRVERSRQVSPRRRISQDLADAAHAHKKGLAILYKRFVDTCWMCCVREERRDRKRRPWHMHMHRHAAIRWMKIDRCDGGVIHSSVWLRCWSDSPERLALMKHVRRDGTSRRHKYTCNF